MRDRMIGAALVALLFAFAACEGVVNKPPAQTAQTAQTPTPEPAPAPLADDHGDKLETATVLTDKHQVKTDKPEIMSGYRGRNRLVPPLPAFKITWAAQGTLTAGDVDVFGVGVNQAGRLTALTMGEGMDTYGEIRTDSEAVLAEDDNGGIDRNFSVTAQVAAGIYLIYVRGGSPDVVGDYTLIVEFTVGEAPSHLPGDDHGDTRSAATLVAPSTTTQGALTAGDVDYFAVSVTEAGTLTANTAGTTDTAGSLETSDGRLLATNDDNGNDRNFRLSREVSAGTYYVKVEGYSRSTTGDYVLHVEFTVGEAPSHPPGDDHGDTRSAATLVAPSTTTQGALTAGDVDYFAVSVTEAGTLTANTAGTTDTLGSLETSDGRLLATNDDNGNDRNFRLSREVSAGTYYVKVEGYSRSTTGDYVLHVEFTPSRATNGSVVFWTRTDHGGGPISIYLGGRYIGRITHTLSGPPSDCETSDGARVTATRAPGRYSFRAEDSSSSWSGAVTIASGGCLLYELTGGGTGPPPNTDGSVVFWTRTDHGGGLISIYLGGRYIGRITHTLSGPPSDCETSDGARVTATRAPGRYSFRAEDSSSSWSGTVTIASGRCLLFELT